MRKILSTLLIAAMLLMSATVPLSCKTYEVARVDDARVLSDFEFTQYNTVSRDQYGRISFVADGEKTDKKRYVGMFFYIQTMEGGTGCYNITDLMNEYGDDFWDNVFKANIPESPVNQNHFWGEPVWGYYKENDEWVMRKQLEMLTMAGVDFLMLDTSNAVIYQEVTDKLFYIIKEYREAGWDVPQIVYQTASGDDAQCRRQVKDLYNKYYVKKDLDDVWFKPDGKPMMIVMNKTANDLRKGTDEEKVLYDYFYFRYKYWPTEATDLKSLSAPWMDFEYPQRVAGDWISVSCAQHTTAAFSDTLGSRGRGWNGTSNDHENYAKGANYERQWDTVFDKDDEVRFTLLTQWNEWTAAKYYIPARGGYIMVDTFNDEFSRDMKKKKTGGMKDNFYMQTIQNIRKYKCNPSKNYNYADRTVSVNYNADEWAGVNRYLDFSGECIERNFQSYDGFIVTDTTNRNDIVSVRVCSDKDNVYFAIETKDPITAYASGDNSWMNIRIRTGNAGETDALGYNYIVNYNVLSDSKTEIGKLTKKGYEKAGEADYAVSGNMLTVKIPLKTLGLKSDYRTIEFKVSDNVTDPSDVLSFYNSGDSAPIGGLNFSYGY